MNNKYNYNDQKIMNKNVWHGIAGLFESDDPDRFPRKVRELYLNGISVNPLNKRGRVNVNYSYKYGAGDFYLYYIIEDGNIYYYKLKYREGESDIIIEE